MHSFAGLDDASALAAALAAALGVPRVALFSTVTSTMDEAHRLAEQGAPGGTVVLADEQTAGRGRTGRRWVSKPNDGLWMTLLERPASPSGLDVLSLRLGLRLAPVLESFAGTAVQVKWPNDLYLDGARKLCGILVEARWRDERIEWVAVGIGVNIRAPVDMPHSAGLQPATRRLDLLGALVPEIRNAVRVGGPLTREELTEFAARDLSVGRRCSQPAVGVVRGITADGALEVEGDAGVVHCRRGSLVFEGDTE